MAGYRLDSPGAWFRWRSSSDGFANQASQLRIAPLLAEVYFAVGEELGEQAFRTPAQLGIACDVASLAQGSCLGGFIADIGQNSGADPLERGGRSLQRALCDDRTPG